MILSILRRLYVQMLIGIAAGVLVGWLWPSLGVELAPLGVAFVKAMRMMVPPVIFCTIVEGIVRQGEARGVGRTLLRSIALFLAITAVALLCGLIAVTLFKPGQGLDIPPPSAALEEMQRQLGVRSIAGPGDFLIRMIPETLFSAFTSGDVLPVLLVAGLFGFGLLQIRDHAQPLIRGIVALTRLQFAIFGFLIRAAPVGAFGALAFTVGTYGLEFIGSLSLMIATLATGCLMLAIILLTCVRITTGLRIRTLGSTFQDEIVVVLGTSSTEVVLPRLIAKLETLGCPRSVVGLTVPLGYTLNLAGTAVYLIVATMFLAEVTGHDLSAERIVAYLALMLVTSKAAAGITGSGFSALLLTLSVMPDVPVASAAMLVAVDRLMSEIRAITSGIANVSASLLISRWSGVVVAPHTPGVGEEGEQAVGCG